MPLFESQAAFAISNASHSYCSRFGGRRESLRPGQTIEELNYGCEEKGQEGREEDDHQEEGRQKEEVVG